MDDAAAAAATLLKQAFGESSDEEGGQLDGLEAAEGSERESPSRLPHRSTPCQGPTWAPIEEIIGLWLCGDFLSPEQQHSLLSAVEEEGWFTEASHNQAMRFGSLPAWATGLSNSIREAILLGDFVPGFELSNADAYKDSCLFPILPFELLGREPLFDQLIVNLYQPGEGICAHVDLMRFGDGIAIVSLESPCIMHFTRVGDMCNISSNGENGQPMSKVPVYLAPGSLVIMSGEARYRWKHEINHKPGFQLWHGQELDQKRRLSITLRKLSIAE
ncbi:Fe2OG dioxygenase domain-containing protein [Psidium guajava]|nr:Fe2OG dioxygenase domain-containing protein [Psidium guajava]